MFFVDLFALINFPMEKNHNDYKNISIEKQQCYK